MAEYKLVPYHPTPEMIEAAEEAHMPFGDMDMALRMAILAAPEQQVDLEELRKKAEKFEIVERCMNQLQCDERDGGIWTVCTLLLISSAHKLNSARSIVDHEGVTFKDDPIGNWRVTVERIDSEQHAPPAAPDVSGLFEALESAKVFIETDSCEISCQRDVVDRCDCYSCVSTRIDAALSAYREQQP